MSYPAPILNLNFANAKQSVHPAVAFSRGSQGSYFDGSGILRYANNSVPRFDHDPLTGICKGLLVESAVTFLDTYSEQFDNAAWVKTRASITPNAATAPDGGTTADKLVEDTTGTNSHRIYKNFTGTAAVYTSSYVVSAAERTRARVGLFDGTTEFFCNFDLSAKTSTNGTSAVEAFGITDIGGGRLLLWVSKTMAAATCTAVLYIADSLGSTYYTGDGTSGLYIWGAKIYAGTGPTSYLPTVASGVTRAADVCSVDLTKLTRNGSPLWTGTEGTVVIRAVSPGALPASGTGQMLIHIDDGSGYNKIAINRDSAGVLSVMIYTGGVLQASISLGSLADNYSFNLAVSVKTSSFAASLNGSTVVTSSSGSMPAVSTLRIGGSVTGLNQWNSSVRSVQLYNRRIADAYLPALSAL